MKWILFQSTLPVRGATVIPLNRNAGEVGISIHAPRAGSDAMCFSSFIPMISFQSTLPVRGATFAPIALTTRHFISIHAPRAGSDPGVDALKRAAAISIHAPRAGSDFGWFVLPKR